MERCRMGVHERLENWKKWDDGKNVPTVQKNKHFCFIKDEIKFGFVWESIKRVEIGTKIIDNDK
jgi:hypothetical protein